MGLREGYPTTPYTVNRPQHDPRLLNSYEIGSLKAGDTVVLAERLTLTYGGCEASET
jgi:hypothetical protein